MARRYASSPFSLFSFQDIVTCVSGIMILITLMLVVELLQRKQTSPQARTLALASQLREAIAAAYTEVAKLEMALEKDSNQLEELASVSVDQVRREIADTRSEIDVLEAELVQLEPQERKVRKGAERLQAELFDRLKGEKERKALEESTRQLEGQLERIKQSDQLIYNPTTPDGKKVWIAQIDSGRVIVAPAGERQRPEVFEDSIWNSASDRFGSWLTQRSSEQDFFFLLVRPGGAETFDRLRTILTQRDITAGFDLLDAKQTAVDPETGAALP